MGFARPLAQLGIAGHLGPGEVAAQEPEPVSTGT
jgi:hypothetical protein